MRPPQGYAKSIGMPTPSAADPPLPTPADAASEPAANVPRPNTPPNTRSLPDAAARALAEAGARRSERTKAEAGKSQAAQEVGGRAGPDPTRYGDWEINGLASDF